ncbi:hypothetical protein VTL71DRAFT_4840 [Oculimacula yallundae]|uniref:Uncharacterized protein n=1 Tax=Oculimacula yallundae TaxID=86028 RepID=A0ABR4C343_9HELO
MFSLIPTTIVTAILIAVAEAITVCQLQCVACNRDSCLSAVLASGQTPFPSSAKSDCSSFFKKTVTPVVTSTQVLDSTTTANPTSSIVSNALTKTVVFTILVTSTSISIATVLSTSILTSLSTAQVTSAPTITITESELVTVTQQSTAFQGSFEKKRDTEQDIEIIPPRPAPMAARDIEGCAASPSFVTSSPTHVPNYAFLCGGTSRYSSACRCNGVSASTVTAPTSTSTVTLNTGPTVIPTSTITQIATQTETDSTTQSTLQKVIETTTLLIQQTTTIFLTETTVLPTTTTLDISSTATVIAVTTLQPLVCNTFILQTSGGTAVDGKYVRSQGQSQKQAFTSDDTFATIFHLDTAGRLVNGNLIANTDNVAIYYIYDETASTIANQGYPVLTCSIKQNGANTGILSCTSHGANTFAVAPLIGPGDPGPGPALLFGTCSSSDCRLATLTAICLAEGNLNQLDP